MKKFLSMLISFVMILSLIPSGALAVQTYALSEEGIAFIKEFEGFRDMPYEDRGKWYVGYGTVCDPMDYLYPITEMEADWLLRQALADKVERVNKFLMDYNITVTQQQFDALASLTYNLGSQWINPEYRLCSYLINGIYNYSEVEIVNAIATWCHQGQSVLHHLTQRRLREAYLFLYGLYQSDVCDRYTYIHFDPNGGEVENKTVFYPVGYSYGQLPVPEWNGHLFLGWSTEEGAPFTGMEIADKPVHLTAVWDGGSLQQPEQPKQPAEPSEPDGVEGDLSTWVNPYKDVVEEDWYYTYVRELSAKGIVNGYPEDGTFRPAKEVTAGEALKLILLAAGYPEQQPTDVRHWASGYLTLAESLGCVRRGELADLNAPISRMSIAKITAVALGLGERYGVSPFADAESGYLLALYEEGIVEGSIIGRQRYFYPNDGIIRAEVCAIISRVNNWEYEEKNDPFRSGYIEYGDRYYPVLSGVAVSTYDKNLFVKNGSRMYYNDYAYTTALGIDVSSYQGEIDWQKVAADGIEFALIRLGYRGYSEGEIFLDKYFQQNLQGAKAAGLKVGVYFFSQAITAQEAQEEALFVVQNLAGTRLDYPVIYDWEPVDSNSARTMGLAQDVLTDCAIAFCEMVEMMGYTPMVYYNLPVGYSRYDLTRLTEYDVWFAQYAKKPTMYYDYRIWQYTDSGEVDGIEVKVDMNLAFIPY